MKPGDPGVHPSVLAPEAFSQLPAMQAGGGGGAGGGDIGTQQDQQQRAVAAAAALEPRCEWQQYTVPYPADPRYQLTYYNSSTSGQSTYEKPPEFAKWEVQHAAWVASALHG